MKKQEKRQGKYKLGLTWGCWDLFHAGHLYFLKAAKEQCETLYVGVSNNEYSFKHKGKSPVIPFPQRFLIMGSLKDVDRIFIQSIEQGKKEAVEFYKPDVLFVGDDWNEKTYKGMNLGVPVVFLEYTPGVSTTKIIERIKNE